MCGRVPRYEDVRRPMAVRRGNTSTNTITFHSKE
jgi:hypothetical protein